MLGPRDYGDESHCVCAGLPGFGLVALAGVCVARGHGWACDDVRHAHPPEATLRRQSEPVAPAAIQVSCLSLSRNLRPCQNSLSLRKTTSAATGCNTSSCAKQSRSRWRDHQHGHQPGTFLDVKQVGTRIHAALVKAKPRADFGYCKAAHGRLLFCGVQCQLSSLAYLYTIRSPDLFSLYSPAGPAQRSANAPIPVQNSKSGW